MIFLRHPRPAIADGICYGRMDMDVGPDAASQIATALATTPPLAQVIASPALRCRALAQALAQRDLVPLTLDPRLVEMDFGAWEGQAWDQIDRTQSDPWAQDPWRLAPPGGETFQAVHARVAAALDDADPGTALICHAGPIRAAQMILTGAAFDMVFATQIPYATPIDMTAETA